MTENSNKNASRKVELAGKRSEAETYDEKGRIDFLIRFDWRIFILVGLFSLLFVGTGWSGTDDDIDLSGFEDELGGFDAPEDLNNSEDITFVEDNSDRIWLPWLSVNGGLAVASSYNFSHSSPAPGQFDHQDLSRLKLSGDLVADVTMPAGWQARGGVKGFYDFVYDLKGRDDFSAQVVDEYGQELEFDELWLSGSLSKNLDLKIGRQIVVWGKSDNIRVTDILNPLDNREPGVVDIRDLRLPVTMTKLDYFEGAWDYSLIVVHEMRFNKDPVFGNDFFPGLRPSPAHDGPSTSLANQEVALAASGIFSGWDISFYGASVFDDLAHVEQTPSGAVRRHNRLSMLGMAVNLAWGSWLIKAETAYLHGLEYSIDVGAKARLDTLIGAEYNGFNETVLSLELVDRHIFSFDDRLQTAPLYGQEDEVQLAFRASRDYWHDTLKLTALASIFEFNGSGGSFARFTGQYDLTDAVSLTTGLIFYQNGDKTAFRNIGDNDRFFFEARYSF